LSEWPPNFDPRRLLGRILVLTGAGISAGSGLPTFRGAGGLYEGRRVEDLATPEGFLRDPELVWQWYAMRIKMTLSAHPNEAHFALARWQKAAESLTIVSSNVDDLHERAGATVHKLHGAILEARDPETGEVYPLVEAPDGIPTAPSGRMLRPNVVWFGETPRESAFEAALRAMENCDLLVEIGMSGQVTYHFTEAALARGIPGIKINPDAGFIPRGMVWWREPASSAVPRLVEAALSVS
jgi:NAD-dependent deacetylase